MRPIIFPLFTVILFSCNNQEQKKADTPATATKTTATHTCYEGIFNKDSILLELHRSGDTISGQLQYDLFEKDRNTGTFHGLMKGDTLLAYYTFMSEGKESMRQVAFLHKDSSLYEGYGEMEEANGRMLFKKNAALNFPADRPLRKVTCKP